MVISKKRRIVNVFIITCSLLVWSMPYISTMFYEQFLEAYSLTNAQSGLLISAFGASSIVGYMCGGYVADKFSCRKLVATSSATTALLGIMVANTHSFKVLLIIYVGYGVTVTLLQWSSFLKLILAQSSGPEEDGRIMGLFEAFSCIVNVGFAYGVLTLLGKIMEVTGFKGVLYAFSAVLILVAVVILLVISEPEVNAQTDTFSFRMIPLALKHPGTWFQALIMLGIYMITNAASYMNPCLTQVFGASTTLGVCFAIFARYGKNIVGLIGGNIKDRTGKSSTVIFIFIGGAAIAMIMLLCIPQSPKYLIPALLLMSAAIVISGCARPCLYTPIPECGVPMVYMGTAIGIASTIGYSGDLWYYTLCGSMIDKYGNLGYKLVFIIVLLGFTLAIGTAIVMQHWLNNHNEEVVLAKTQR